MDLINNLVPRFEYLLKYDKSTLIFYSSISLAIYYILEKIEFRKIALAALCFIFIFFTKEKNFVSKVSGDNKSDRINVKVKEIKHKNKNIKENIELEIINKHLKDLETFIKVNVRETIPTSSNTKEVNLVYDDIVELMEMYLNEIEGIMEIGEYKHKNYEKLLDIKKEINIEIHSLFLK